MTTRLSSRSGGLYLVLGLVFLRYAIKEVAVYSYLKMALFAANSSAIVTL